MAPPSSISVKRDLTAASVDERRTNSRSLSSRRQVRHIPDSIKTFGFNVPILVAHFRPANGRFLVPSSYSVPLQQLSPQTGDTAHGQT